MALQAGPEGISPAVRTNRNACRRGAPKPCSRPLSDNRHAAAAALDGKRKGVKGTLAAPAAAPPVSRKRGDGSPITTQLPHRPGRATGLKRKHVDALVAEWQRRGLAVGTMKNRMSVLRWWAEHVGRPGVVGTNAAHGIGERRYVTNEDRSAVLDPEKLAGVKDEHVRMSLELQAAFGLRREEAIKFMPAYADRSTSPTRSLSSGRRHR